MSKEQKTKTVYSKRVAIQLRKLGFDILETVVNTHDPQYDAYVFEDTQKFREAFNSILQKIK